MDPQDFKANLQVGPVSLNINADKNSTETPEARIRTLEEKLVNVMCTIGVLEKKVNDLTNDLALHYASHDNPPQS